MFDIAHPKKNMDVIVITSAINFIYLQTFEISESFIS